MKAVAGLVMLCIILAVVFLLATCTVDAVGDGRPPWAPSGGLAALLAFYAIGKQTGGRKNG
jgi:hypothetical protein